VIRYINLSTLGLSSDYEVSDNGTVRAGTQRGECVLTPYPHRDHGCLMVLVRTKNGTRCQRSLARLVLTAFRGERSRAWEPKHRNGDPKDCRLANLKWERKCAESAYSVKKRAIATIVMIMKKHGITLKKIGASLDRRD